MDSEGEVKGDEQRAGCTLQETDTTNKGKVGALAKAALRYSSFSGTNMLLIFNISCKYQDLTPTTLFRSLDSASIIHAT